MVVVLQAGSLGSLCLCVCHCNLAVSQPGRASSCLCACSPQPTGTLYPPRTRPAATTHPPAAATVLPATHSLPAAHWGQSSISTFAANKRPPVCLHHHHNNNIPSLCASLACRPSAPLFPCHNFLNIPVIYFPHIAWPLLPRALSPTASVHRRLGAGWPSRGFVSATSTPTPQSDSNRHAASCHPPLPSHDAGSYRSFA